MNTAYSIIVHIFLFFATYFVVLYILLLIDNRNKLFKDKKRKMKRNPFVSFIVPAYNEEKTIETTIKSLLGLNYPKDKYEIIILNDGSRDKTAKIVKKYVQISRIRFIDDKKNKGKANRLNEGLDLARGEFVVCMDADSIAEKDVLKKALPIFCNKKVGAVTVAVKVMNNNKLLTKLIELEYILGLSLLLRIYSMADAVYVTPGPFALFRKSVLKKIGGFDPDNITEDHEIALKIMKNGYKIKNTMNAAVYTNSPDKLKTLYTQRKRWYTGSLSTFFQYKDMMFKSKYGMVGFLLPFNYFLITIGIIMISVSLYLSIRNSIKSIINFSLTNFNFFENWRWSWDIYTYGQVDMITTLSIFFSFLVLFIGLKLSKVSIRTKVKAIVLYPLLFWMYQVFWTSSFISLIFKRNVKWR